MKTQQADPSNFVLYENHTDDTVLALKIFLVEKFSSRCPNVLVDSISFFDPCNKMEETVLSNSDYWDKRICDIIKNIQPQVLNINQKYIKIKAILIEPEVADFEVMVKYKIPTNS